MTATLATTELAEVKRLRIAEPGARPAAVYLASLSPGSRRSMLHGLNVIAETGSGGRHDAESLPWHRLRHEDTNAIRAALAERYSPSSANLFLSAMRGVLKACWRLRLMDAETYARAVDVKRVKGDDVNDDDRAGRSVEYREAKAMFKVIADDPTSTGRRDAALLALLWCCGLRRAELVGLNLGDVSVGDDAITLHIRGKGNRTRTAYVTGGAAEALRAWLSVRGDHAGTLFHPTKQGGHVERDRGLTTQAVYARLSTLARRADVGAFSPHDLRRTFVGDLLDAGVDLSTVQALAGHANVTTTQRYDRRPGEVKRAAMLKRRTPYREAKRCC